ncbi:MAG TPA: hypothetical protein VMV94_14780 [Phycisphaerae bacterium]|nr:hypothetical protein [Phycisphaerae bacterium]
MEIHGGIRHASARDRHSAIHSRRTTFPALSFSPLIEMDGELYLFEVKSGATIVPRHASSLLRARSDFGENVGAAGVISQSAERFMLQDGVFS